jgi:hypothetical protein
MRRRKFLIGAGSLAAAGAAVMGTSAFSQADIRDRPVSVAVTNDASSLVGLLANDSGLPNDEYATYTDGGELTLAFDGSTVSDPGGFVGGAGDGLNTDSTYFFDGVFGVASKSQEKISPEIDWSSLDNPDNFQFYATAAGGQPSQVNPSSYTITAGDVPGGAYTDIGVAIKTPDTLDTSWETGSISLTVTSQGEQTV